MRDLPEIRLSAEAEVQTPVLKAESHGKVVPPSIKCRIAIISFSQCVSLTLKEDAFPDF